MTADAESLRLFVAIELPGTWKQALAALQERMRDELAADTETAAVRLRWTRPEGIHLTLKFIGAVTLDRLPIIEEQLSHAVPALGQISLRLGWAGSFHDRRAPRVIWAGVDSDPPGALAPLAASIETWLAAAGVKRERRGFTPHLTLARLPDEMSDELRRRVAELTVDVPRPQPVPFVVEHVSLMQSHLEPGGARYERIATFPP
jgi:2'-5' RNA ligase